MLASQMLRHVNCCATAILYFAVAMIIASMVTIFLMRARGRGGQD